MGVRIPLRGDGWQMIGARTMADRKPWGIRQDESVRAHAAFQVYCELGPERSLERLCQVHTVALPTAKAWSVRHDWQARVRAFDEAVAARAADRALEDAVAVRARQAADAKRLQELGIGRLATLPPGQLKPGHAIQAWKVGAEAERKALGIADKVELAGEAGVRITFAYEDAKPGDEEGADGARGRAGGRSGGGRAVRGATAGDADRGGKRWLMS